MENEVKEICDTFLCLSSTGWSALSTIVTLVAVLVALFLPAYYEYKKRRNLCTLIEYEILENLKLLIKANLLGNNKIDLGGTSKIKLMTPILVNLDLQVWNSNNQTIAEISSKKFLKYSDIINQLTNIKKHSEEIKEKQGNCGWVGVIADEVKRCIQSIERKNLNDE